MAGEEISWDWDWDWYWYNTIDAKNAKNTACRRLEEGLNTGAL